MTDLFHRRKSFEEELTHPDVLDRLFAIAVSENNSHPGRMAVMETVFNRAQAYGWTLSRTMSKAYYASLQNGAVDRNLAALKRSTVMWSLLRGELEEVLNGSNVSKMAIHNASRGMADEARRTQTVTVEITGETYSRKDNPAFADLHGAGTVKKEAAWFHRVSARA